MDLYNFLGACLRPLGSQQRLFKLKDHWAAMLVDRAGEMCDACIEAQDMTKALKYSAISIRLIKYRQNLIERYPLGY